MAEGTHGREITLDQMLALRASTEKAGAWLRAELDERIETLRSLLHPRRYLGDHVKSAVREDVKDADRNFEALQAAFKESAGGPLKLPGRLDSPVDGLSARIDVHPWEYAHDLGAGAAARRITVKSPVAWVLTHSSNITFAQVRQMLSGGAARNEAELRQFAISACLMKVIVDRAAGLVRLLEGLRYRVTIDHAPETGKLPLVRLTSCVPTFRPADGVISNAVKLSGVPIFEELIDDEAIAAIEDPIRTKLASILAS